MRFVVTILIALLVFRPDEGRSFSCDSAASDVQSDVVTSRHTIEVRGTAVTYTARAGFIPLYDAATGAVHARIFFVSYSAEPRRGERVRPLTFYTNGGPGESATVSYLGPRSLKGGKTEWELPPPPYQMIDNQETWLTMTDLVLIDPVGTGYSRAIQSQYNSDFYNPDADAESVAQFMQLYLRKYDPALRQPVFVAGHSYATIRSALIADIANRRGIPLRGLILASSALANQLPRDNLYYPFLLPTFTATAFVHKKLPPDLQRNFNGALERAEAWAVNEYPGLLARADDSSGNQLGAAAAEMARLTGLPAEVALENHLRLLPDAFLRELLGEQWTPAGLFDSRKLKADESAGWQDPQSLTVLSDLYLRGELHVSSEMSYADDPLLVRQWSCGIHCGVDPQALVRLKRAMRENRSLQVMITNGYFDFTTPYFGTKHTFSQWEPDLRSRVHLIYYKAGHDPPPEHRQAVAGFIKKVAAISRNSEPHR